MGIKQRLKRNRNEVAFRIESKHKTGGVTWGLTKEFHNSLICICTEAGPIMGLDI